jgi:hypothetical protein
VGCTPLPSLAPVAHLQSLRADGDDCWRNRLPHTRRHDSAASVSSLIGRPLPNTTAYIWTIARGRFYGIKESCTWEETAWRGHLNQTADRSSCRIRPTIGTVRASIAGDLTRHSPDGNIEFLGGGIQVKIRGFRVELGSGIRHRPPCGGSGTGRHDRRAKIRRTRLVAYVAGGHNGSLSESGVPGRTFPTCSRRSRARRESAKNAPR